MPLHTFSLYDTGAPYLKTGEWQKEWVVFWHKGTQFATPQNCKLTNSMLQAIIMDLVLAPFF